MLRHRNINFVVPQLIINHYERELMLLPPFPVLIIEPRFNETSPHIVVNEPSPSAVTSLSASPPITCC